MLIVIFDIFNYYFWSINRINDHYVCFYTHTDTHNDQQTLLELLNAGGMKDIDEVRVLKLAEKAKFYRVCELVYRNQHKYAKVLYCLISDPGRHSQVWYGIVWYLCIYLVRYVVFIWHVNRVISLILCFSSAHSHRLTYSYTAVWYDTRHADRPWADTERAEGFIRRHHQRYSAISRNW